MDTIAEQARVSKATVYAYFASKELLFRTTLEAAAHAACSQWTALLVMDGALEPRLIAVADAVQRMASRRALDDTAYALVRPPLLPAQMREETWVLCFERYDDMMRALLAREVARGVLAIDNLADASVHFFGLATGMPPSAAARAGQLQTGAGSAAAYLRGAVAVFMRAYRPGTLTLAAKPSREVPGGF